MQEAARLIAQIHHRQRVWMARFDELNRRQDDLVVGSTGALARSRDILDRLRRSKAHGSA
jgi:hypothetical protein